MCKYIHLDKNYIPRTKFYNTEMSGSQFKNLNQNFPGYFLAPGIIRI